MATPVELKEEIIDWFMQDPLRTLKDCAEHFDVPYETVRGWGKTEAWYQRRIKSSDLGELPDGVAEQAEAIRLVLVRRIVSGIELDSEQLANLVKSWHSIVGISPVEPSGVDRDTLLADDHDT